MKNQNLFLLLCWLLLPTSYSIVCAQNSEVRTNIPDPFAQLQDDLPTPNVYRTASGAPGVKYWQQRADYKMDIRIDDNEQKLYGEQTVTYYNQSPDALPYLWVQLDQNVRALDSDSHKIRTSEIGERGLSLKNISRLGLDFDGGFKIEYVQDKNGRNIPYTINKTMMRIDLPQPLAPGASFVWKIKWHYQINDRMKIGGRSGYEYFEDEDNYLYTIAQFYPRMATYTDNEGWQNKQFLGRGEFALTFGNYDVKIIVPADHILGSTGTLQNATQVLSAEQRRRLAKAKTAKTPIMIVSQAEAEQNETTKAQTNKTWHFKADNVRDFAFASSRKFIWDAMGVPMGNRTVMAMSYYPKEGNPLWEQYSTKAVAHTLRVYSKHTFDYPYPKAISVHAKSIGMEYPMICFNFGRPEPDGTYSPRTKYGMISVIIHEVGHNYFPMIVNSDERQWTWMDEGLNSFLQYLAEQEWQRDYPSRRGPAPNIVKYMKGNQDEIRPIMTNSESIYQFGNNAYGKPATALNILRETIMGRELFDFAFKTYAQRWQFKHPTPADFFRTMEDASAVDLDWFWRAWFYGTKPVNLSIDNVQLLQVNTRNPQTEKALSRQQYNEEAKYITNIRNQKAITQTYAEQDTALLDFYNKHDQFSYNSLDENSYKNFRKSLTNEQLTQFDTLANKYFYQVTCSNKGGAVMPIILQFTLADGTTELHQIPAEIWRHNPKTINKVFILDQAATQITLDPYLETADIDRADNYYPPKTIPTRFSLYKQSRRKQENTMQRENRAIEFQKQQQEKEQEQK